MIIIKKTFRSELPSFRTLCNLFVLRQTAVEHLQSTYKTPFSGKVGSYFEDFIIHLSVRFILS